MTQVVSFENYTPPARFDSIPWANVKIEESDTTTFSDLTVWTTIDTIALSPLDVDPATPATRSFTTSNASDTPNLWYRLTFADGVGDESLPSVPVQNLEFSAAPYSTVDELFRILKVRTPSAAQTSAANRCLLAATGEINSEIDLADGVVLSQDWQQALLASVCVDRAADLWRHTESIPGVGTILDDGVISSPGRYSWERYAQRLAPLKDQWGIA
jgi:hypothetical protein